MAGLAPTTRTQPAGKRHRPRRYTVKSIWKTVQGEGFFAGRPAVFVRFTGCNMWSGYEDDRARDAGRSGAACPLWCDTDFTKQGATSFEAEVLARRMTASGGAIRFCVLTGGEPLLQLDATLIQTLHDAGFFVAVETNGSVALTHACTDSDTDMLVAPDWVVCSPKQPERLLKLEFFDELKLVVPDYHPAQYRDFVGRRRSHRVGGHEVPLCWLQPEDGPRRREATELAVEMALRFPDWRVSVQTHKVLGVD